MKKNSIQSETFIMIVFVSFGIILRFFVMSFGHNFDFDSYQIVGEIISRGGNVYAETERYNYGFIFFLIQGIGYSVSSHFPDVAVAMYRVYIVSVLTFADVGIALFLYQKYGKQAALLFFLNPISIIITGYHNQFDNIAVLFALLAVECIDTRTDFSRKDVLSIMLFSVSLITKHIMAFYFLWMLFNTNFPNIKKRLAYSCAPPALFLISFTPFCITNTAALQGIINNVFLYKSYNNCPLLGALLKLARIPEQLYFFIFIFIIVTIGLLLRKVDFQKLLPLYFASLVAFSSAIANQYLIIPLVSLIVFEKKLFYWAYTSIGLLYCVLNNNELHLAERFANRMPSASNMIFILSKEGGLSVTLMTYILVAYIIFSAISINQER